MKIENAKYQTAPMPDDDTIVGISADINGRPHFVSIDEQNRHYQEILLQVAAGTLTISDAD